MNTIDLSLWTSSSGSQFKEFIFGSVVPGKDQLSVVLAQPPADKRVVITSLLLHAVKGGVIRFTDGIPGAAPLFELEIANGDILPLQGGMLPLFGTRAVGNKLCLESDGTVNINVSWAGCFWRN